MALTFTRKYLDVDGNASIFWQLVNYEDGIITWNTKGGPERGECLYSEDGSTWSPLFSVDVADVGPDTFWDGMGLAVYKKNIFVTLYTGDENRTKPKVIEWDSASITKHLTTIDAGDGCYNLLAYGLVVWNRHLFVITDYTFKEGFGWQPGQRVVYYYDGSSWTAITDYDGAAWLDYNRAAPNEPIIDIKHRTTRLFVFNGELYLMAYRYDSEWRIEFWKFDAENYDQFNFKSFVPL